MHFTSYGDMINNGSILSSPPYQNDLHCYGTSLTNNGIIQTNWLRLGSSTNFLLSGSGTINTTKLQFSAFAPNSVILQSDLSISSQFIYISDTGLNTLNLNTHSLSVSNVNIYFYRDSGIVKGSGAIKSYGQNQFYLYNNSKLDLDLHVKSGTTYFGYKSTRPIIIDSAATLNIGTTADLRLYDFLINYGTIAGTGAFTLFGNNVVNSGTIVSGVGFNFETGSHTLYGTGVYNGPVYFKTGSSTTLTSNHKMSSININSGAIFDISGYTLSLSSGNPITNNGTFITSTLLNDLNSGVSTIEYNGTTSQSLSTTNVTYRNLRINNPAGVTSGNFNWTLNDTLSLVSGDFNIGASVLTLSPTATLIETPGNTVIASNPGYIGTTQVLNAPSALNVMNLGAVITSSANLGSTVIKRVNTYQNMPNGNTSILRFYDITPTNNTGLNATLTFKYDDSELNGKPEGSLQLYRSTNNGSTWTFRGGTINTNTNEITVSGIDAFSRWTAFSGYLTSSIKVIPEGLYNSATNRLNRKDTVRAYLRNISSTFRYY